MNKQEHIALRRHHKREVRSTYEKKTIKIERQYNEALKAKYRRNKVEDIFEYVELDTPYLLYYERMFAVKENVDPRKKVILRKLLPLIQNTAKNKTNDFSHCKVGYDPDVNKVVDNRQFPRVIEEKIYNTFTDEEKSYFLVEYHTYQLTNSVVVRKSYYLNDWNKLLKFKIEKVFATHMRIPRSDLESLLDKLQRKYYNSGFFSQWTKKQSKNHWKDRYRRAKEKRNFDRDMIEMAYYELYPSSKKAMNLYENDEYIYQQYSQADYFSFFDILMDKSIPKKEKDNIIEQREEEFYNLLKNILLHLITFIN